ncbi:MAG: NAD(P)-binding domain-containing protein [Burkholderiaceae bacterium]
MTDVAKGGQHGGSCRVAFVGSGNMGGAMVARLRALGWPVAVCDVDPARQEEARAAGALVCASPAAAVEALAAGGVLVLAVVTAAQCREVLSGAEGAIGHLRQDQVVMLCPTIAPDEVEAMAALLGERGVACIDAPMSGGPARAREGSMSLMLAGRKDVLALHHDFPCLRPCRASVS